MLSVSITSPLPCIMTLLPTTSRVYSSSSLLVTLFGINVNPAGTPPLLNRWSLKSRCLDKLPVAVIVMLSSAAYIPKSPFSNDPCLQRKKFTAIFSSLIMNLDKLDLCFQLHFIHQLPNFEFLQSHTRDADETQFLPVDVNRDCHNSWPVASFMPYLYVSQFLKCRVTIQIIAYESEQEILVAFFAVNRENSYSNDHRPCTSCFPAIRNRHSMKRQGQNSPIERSFPRTTCTVGQTLVVFPVEWQSTFYDIYQIRSFISRTTGSENRWSMNRKSIQHKEIGYHSVQCPIPFMKAWRAITEIWLARSLVFL